MNRAVAAIDQHDDITVISFPQDPASAAGSGGTTPRNDGARVWIAEHFLGATAHVQRIVMDFSGVSTLDSAALGPLIQRLRELQGQRGRFAVAGINSPALREIFSLTRFDQIFPIFPTSTEAVRAVREDPTARFARRR